MSCNECNSESAKYRYKCCLRNFCSTDCFKVHLCPGNSDSETPSTEDTPSVSFNSQPAPTSSDSSTDSPYPKLTERHLAILKSDEKLQEYLKDERLKKMLKEVSDAEDPNCKAQQYMADESFNKFVQYLMEVIDRF